MSTHLSWCYGIGAGGEEQPVSIYFKIPRLNKFTFMTTPRDRTPARVQLTPALGVYREAGATEMNYGARPSRKWENIRGVSRKSVAMDLIGCTHGGQRRIEERM